MKQPPKGTEEKLAKVTFASVYPLYLTKIEKKGRSKDELDTVIRWLTGLNEAQLASFIEDEADFREFFNKCRLNENAYLIRGVVCGYRVEELESELIRNVRYLDKLVDELAQGKKLQSVMRRTD